jgi:hypothetical protein
VIVKGGGELIWQILNLPTSSAAWAPQAEEGGQHSPQSDRISKDLAKETLHAQDAVDRVPGFVSLSLSATEV